MNRFKRVFILLGVLVVACIATVIVTRTEEKKEQIQNTDEVILSVAPDTVQALSWSYDETELSFRREEDWHWTEDEAFPVNAEKIEALLSDFEQFGAVFIIEEVEDFGLYGLDDPVCTIRLETDTDTYEILLGDYSAMDSRRYVSIGDGNVYLVKNDPFDDYEIELDDTILHDDTPSFETITALTFEGTENYTITREEESTATYCADDVYFTQKDEKTVPLDTYRVEDYGADISVLNLETYATYNVTEEELAAWGLDTPELTVVVDYTVTDEEENETAESFTLHLGRNQAELAEKEEAEANDEEYTGTVTAYARVGDSALVYQISTASYEELMAASYNDLRHTEVFTADFDSVTQLDISLDGSTYSLVKTLVTDDGEEAADADEDAEYIFTYEGGEIDLTALQGNITDLSVNEFTEDAPSETTEISLVFYTDNENYPQIDVTLYRYDGSDCLAVLDGEVLGLVSRSSVVDVIEAVNAIILG